MGCEVLVECDADEVREVSTTFGSARCTRPVDRSRRKPKVDPFGQFLIHDPNPSVTGLSRQLPRIAS